MKIYFLKSVSANALIRITFIILFLIMTGTNMLAKRDMYNYITLYTNVGEITFRLYNQTPLHRDNFIKLVKGRFFDGILFHRVIDNFMIQTGDPDSKAKEAGKLYGNGGPGYDLPAEIIPGLYHKRGVVAAAREGDSVNPERKSSGSQFYIVKGKVFDDEGLKTVENRINSRNAANNIQGEHTIPDEWRDIYKTVGGTPHLDTQYTVFGEVIHGYDIVETISGKSTDSNDRPVEDIIILSVKIKKSRKLK
ncbi:MAG TPA: peptidylprolyl isomerase [Rikenellaceae bacterium]|nr:peptidylprolyl isomerase [Rikenellaceae bacterium]